MFVSLSFSDLDSQSLIVIIIAAVKWYPIRYGCLQRNSRRRDNVSVIEWIK